MTDGLDVSPLTPDRWNDLCVLFGDRGAYSGCWCMWWRLSGSQWSDNGNAGNRGAFAALVADGASPGILAYRDGVPVGWVAVAPRPEFGRILRSRQLAPPTVASDRAEDRGVWSITCFYIDRRHRGQRVATELLTAAVEFAASRGAAVVEGYPVDPDVKRRSNADSFTGLLGMFSAAGFTEVARRSAGRPVVRLTIDGR